MPEQHQDGVSLVTLLMDEKSHLEREAIYWHYPHYGNHGGTPASAIRWHNYKLIYFFEEDRVEIYNLKTDVEEKINLATGKPDLVRKMKKMLDEWLEDVEGRVPAPNK